MNKTELAAAISQETGLSKKDAEAAVKAFVDVVTKELVKDGKVQLVGFGTFEVSKRAAREGRNPQTGQEVIISGRRVLTFRPSAILRKVLNEENKRRELVETRE